MKKLLAYGALPFVALQVAACSEDPEPTPVYTPNPGNILADAGSGGAPVLPGEDAGFQPGPGPGPGPDPEFPEDDSGTEQPEEDAGPQEPPRALPKCVQKDSQVLVMGDSYINWLSHTFTQDIVAESGQNWRMLAEGGMSMATGGAGYFLGHFIPNQFDDAMFWDPDAHTVLMDGGGNDVLVGEIQDPAIGACKDTGSSQNPVCHAVVDRALAAAEAMMERAIDAGIRDVVYFFYPHIPEDRPIGGPHPNEMLDYALPRVREFCESREEASNGLLRCLFIDMVPVFEGHNPEWFNEDIHPNPEGSKAMAKHIWETMTEHCIGQKESSGCCEP